MSFSRVRIFGILLLVATLVLCFAVIAQRSEPSRGKSALDKPTFEAYVRHLFVWGPQIEVKISDPRPSELPGFYQVTVEGSAGKVTLDRLFYVSKDGRKIVQGAVYDIAENPFAGDLSKLTTDSAPSLGTPGAPVVLVLFSDFECPYCRQEAKMLRENLTTTYPKQVRLYFKDFPLEQIHPWAKLAAIAGRCIYQQNPAAFWQYHDWMYEHQSEITVANLKDKVLEFARTKDIDVMQLSRGLATRSTEAEVDESIAEARALQLNSTPTLFVNGRRITTQLSWQQLQQIIDYEIDYQKTAHNAGDSTCCEVSLPSPLSK
jgi:protein-disulfide isomerase